MTANQQKKVVVDEVGTFYFPTAMTENEIKRGIAASSGAAWVSNATVCTEPDGSLRLKRPVAAAKG